MERDDAVFRALADASRRTLLDRLFERDGQALGELCEALPDMTRIGVMKHLRLLERAGVVVSHRSGRKRLHYLNPVPIRRLHDGWFTKFRTRAADALAELRIVAQVFIKATPERVWQAITDPELTPRYYYGSTVESDWQPASPIRYRIGEADALVGTIIEADPPHRLVHTFEARWDDDVAAEAPSRMTWEIVEVEPGITKVTTIHDGFGAATATAGQVDGGSSYILSALKTLLETGEALAAA